MGVAWLRHIVAGRSKLADRVAAGIRQFVDAVAPPEAGGQVVRVARRFALVAIAGELATALGLTGWAEGEAHAAARKCFAAWLNEFGCGNREARTILAHVRKFFESHGQARFAQVHEGGLVEDRAVSNRAGFTHRLPTGEREFWVLPETFRTELCAGFDQRTATRELVDAGWLIPSAGERHIAQRQSIVGMGRVRVYVFSANMWASDE